MKSRSTLCIWETHSLWVLVTGMQANRFARLWCCQWAWMRMYQCKHLWVYLCLLCHFDKCGIPAAGISLFLSFQNFQKFVCVFGIYKPIVWCSLSLIWAGVHDWRGWGQQSPSISVCKQTAYQCRAMAMGLQEAFFIIFLFTDVCLALINVQVGGTSCVSLLTRFGWLVCVVLCRWEVMATIHFQFRVLVLCCQFKAVPWPVFVKRFSLFLSISI